MKMASKLNNIKGSPGGPVVRGMWDGAPMGPQMSEGRANNVQAGTPTDVVRGGDLPVPMNPTMSQGALPNVDR